MLDVPDIHAIRSLHQRGVSKRQIAKLLHISRKTVERYTAPDFVVEAEPHMVLRRPRPAPKLDRWKPVIEQWLAEDGDRPRKQRRTARKIHRDLVAVYGAEVDVSEVTVRRYVAQCKERQAKTAFVPLVFPPGAMAQVDFGHALVVIAGQERTLPFVAMRLMASTASFVKMYSHEKLEALLDGVATGLGFLGGVPQQLVFDNTSLIVRDILAGGRRLLTPEFRALAAHYGFEAVFTNPAAANEKGGVERLVQWAQKNPFSPVPEASSLAELNEKLWQQCLADAEMRRRPEDGPLVADLWEQEQAHLGPLPVKPFPACRHRFVRVDKTLLSSYDRAVYSAPANFAGKSLLLRAFWDRVELVDRGKIVAAHERQEPGGYSLKLEHYLPVLSHKPRAVAHAAVIARGEPGIARYRDGFLATRPGEYRELVAVLRLCEEVGMARLTAALETAQHYHAYDLESVRALLAMAEPGTDLRATTLTDAQLQQWPETQVRTVESEAYAWMNQVASGADAR